MLLTGWLCELTDSPANYFSKYSGLVPQLIASKWDGSYVSEKSKLGIIRISF